MVRHQVFISSTYKDLIDARYEVSQALLRCDCFPAGMELFPAANEEQFNFIKKIIDECDYYILISAGRYGAIEPKSGRSYTELEYDYAVQQNKTIIRFLHKDPFSLLRGDLLEQTDSGKAMLRDFRKKVSERHLIRQWLTSSELGKEVILGVLEAKRTFPTAGWVKSGSESNLINDHGGKNEILNSLRSQVEILEAAVGQAASILITGQSKSKEVSSTFDRIMLDSMVKDSSKGFNPKYHPHAVLSPMVGTAYTEPAPNSDKFVEIGSSVNEGDTLLLIEAMKTFNPVSSPVNGIVEAVFVESGTPVEFGEALLIVRPHTANTSDVFGFYRGS